MAALTASQQSHAIIVAGGIGASSADSTATSTFTGQVAIDYSTSSGSYMRMAPGTDGLSQNLSGIARFVGDPMMEDAKITEKHKKEQGAEAVQIIEILTDVNDTGTNLEDAEAVNTTVGDSVMEEAKITAKHTDEEGAETIHMIGRLEKVGDMGSNLEDGGKDGNDAQMPAFIELVRDAQVFANCKSWKIRYNAKEKDVFMPLSAPKYYNDFGMIPVFGGGAIQEDFVRPCPASVVIS